MFHRLYRTDQYVWLVPGKEDFVRCAAVRMRGKSCLHRRIVWQTYVYRACLANDAEALMTLLEHPDIDADVRIRMRPIMLMESCRTGARHVFKALVADPLFDANIVDVYGRSPGQVAHIRGWFDDVDAWLQRPEVSVHDASTWLVYQCAHAFGRTGNPRDMLRHLPRDINAPNRKGCTVLRELLRCRNVSADAINVLVGAGADVSVREAYGKTLLYMYLFDFGRQARADIIHAIVDAGVDVNARTNDGDTALWCAIRFGFFKCVKALLSCRDIDPNIRDARGEPPVLFALRRYGDIDSITRTLIHDRRVDINATDRWGDTVLMRICKTSGFLSDAIWIARPDVIVDPPGRGPPYALDAVTSRWVDENDVGIQSLVKLSCFEALRNMYSRHAETRRMVVKEIKYRCRWTTRNLRRMERGEMSRRALVHCLVLASTRGFGSAALKES